MPYVDPTAVRAAATELAKPFGEEVATGVEADAGSGSASGPTTEDPYRLHEELQATMGSLVGIFRTEADLDEAIGRLAQLRERWNAIRIAGGRAYNPSWGLVYEVRNMLIVSEAVARSAKARRESRGAHSRIDFPDPDPVWAKKNNSIALAGEAMKITATKLPAMPKALSELITMEPH
jgi:succinate dehydrogenase / fumarate reductase flavoprotein subunit